MEDNVFTSIRIIDGKRRKVIVDENGDIINRNPSKEELKCSKRELSKRQLCSDKEYLLRRLRQFYEENGKVPREKDFINNSKYPGFNTYIRMFGSWNSAIRDAGLWNKRYNEENECEFIDTDNKRCIEKLCPKNALQFNINGKFVWYCRVHGYRYYQKYDHNSHNNMMKLIRNCRTGNQNPGHPNTKGDNDVELVCRLYGYVDLNKKYDNHNTEIDCLDEETGLLHQVKGRLLRIISEYTTTKGEDKRSEGWSFGSLEREWKKEYKSMIFICKSSEGKIVEKIYRFPFDEINGSSKIEGRRNITIYQNPTDRWGDTIIPWYEQYRVIDKEELKSANEIWQEIYKDKIIQK